MRRAHRLTLLFAVSSLVVSCAAGSQTDSARPRGSRTVISREELADLPAQQNVLQAVRRLRSTWLRTRGRSTAQGVNEIMVYSDGVRLGGLDILESRPLDGIVEIRFHNGRDATTRWGTGVGAGVIELITRM